MKLYYCVNMYLLILNKGAFIMKKLIHFLLIIALAVTFVFPTGLNIPVHAATSSNSIYTVLFDTQGGSANQVIQVVNGSSIAYLPTPTKTNFKFKGWYTSATYKTEFLPTTPVFRNTTVYAKWDYFVPSGATTEEGWKNVISEIASLSKGDILNIEMNTAILPKEVLSAIQGKDVYLALNFTFYKWTIHGKDITTIEDTDFGITTRQLMYTYYPSDFGLLEKMKDDKLELTFSSKSNLPKNSELSVLVNKEQEDYYVSLYRFNEDILEHEFVKTSVIDDYGYTKLVLNEPATYTLLITEFLPDKIKTAVTAAPTIPKQFTISRWEELNLKSKIKNLGKPVVTAFTSSDPETLKVSFYKGIVSPIDYGKTQVYIQIDYEKKTYYLTTTIFVE